MDIVKGCNLRKQVDNQVITVILNIEKTAHFHIANIESVDSSFRTPYAQHEPAAS